MGIPTKFPVKHKCGHSQLIDLANNRNDKLDRGPTKREGFATWLSEKWSDPDDGRDCSKGFKASRNKDTELNERQWMLDIEEFDTKYKLPELRGTEKMIDSGLVDSARKGGTASFRSCSTLSSPPFLIYRSIMLKWGGAGGVFSPESSQKGGLDSA